MKPIYPPIYERKRSLLRHLLANFSTPVESQQSLCSGTPPSRSLSFHHCGPAAVRPRQAGSQGPSAAALAACLVRAPPGAPWALCVGLCQGRPSGAGAACAGMEAARRRGVGGLQRAVLQGA